jgi:DNA-binding transcriptional ArsR family regulator
LSVVEIARGLPVSRPAVSQHLKVLENARLVVARARGTRRIYQHDARGLAALKEYFERFWGDALDAFRLEAERSWHGLASAGSALGREGQSPKSSSPEPRSEASPVIPRRPVIRGESSAAPRRRPARHPPIPAQSARRKRKPA